MKQIIHYLNEMNLESMSHPPYSLHLAPLDLYFVLSDAPDAAPSTRTKTLFFMSLLRSGIDALKPGLIVCKSV